MGVTMTLVLSNLIADYETFKGGVEIVSIVIRKSEIIMKSLIPRVMAGILTILLSQKVCMRFVTHNCEKLPQNTLISRDLPIQVQDYVVLKLVLQEMLVQEEMYNMRDYFIGLILILIFAETLTLYSLIVSLILLQS